MLLSFDDFDGAHAVIIPGNAPSFGGDHNLTVSLTGKARGQVLRIRLPLKYQSHEIRYHMPEYLFHLNFHGSVKVDYGDGTPKLPIIFYH